MSSTPTAVEITRGDLFAVEVEAIVNPVNTRGVMGKGLALAFKKKFPDAFRAYAKACEGSPRSGVGWVGSTGTTCGH
jgi:O-acetyl-ADP-ribose deacetylase (regulator of RNase III)